MTARLASLLLISLLVGVFLVPAPVLAARPPALDDEGEGFDDNIVVVIAPPQEEDESDGFVLLYALIIIALLGGGWWGWGYFYSGDDCGDSGVGGLFGD